MIRHIVMWKFRPGTEKEMKEFCELCGIEGEPQPLYGEIINVKYDTDEDFRNSFDEYLSKVLSMKM